MVTKEIELRQRELDIEEKKLKLEEDKAHINNKFINKHFGVIITLIISLATVIVSITQVIISDRTKNQELEISKKNIQYQLKLAEIENSRRFELDIANYLTTNRKLFFTGSSIEKKQLLEILIASFEDEKVSRLFERINNTQELAKDPTVTVFIHNYKEEQLRKNILAIMVSLGGDGRYNARKDLIYQYTKDPNLVQEIMLDRLKNSKTKNIYREQVGIVYALGQIQGGWEDLTGISDEIRKIIAKSNDKTLQKRAKDAINNRINATQHLEYN